MGPGSTLSAPSSISAPTAARCCARRTAPACPATLERTASGRWLAGLAFEADAVLPYALLPGVAVLLVEAPYVAAVEAALGPPDLRGEDGAAGIWRPPLLQPRPLR
ncbi:MAG: hypothetical protein IPK67_19690 [Planctomycetes bacterium]|nr:hypothetical protein [Planctomycetota bacterium]